MFTPSPPPFQNDPREGGHPANRASFCFLIGKKKALLESCQTFAVAAAETSGLVNLVSSCQTGFFECKHLFFEEPMVIIALFSDVRDLWPLSLPSPRCLRIRLWSHQTPLQQAHGYYWQAWFQNYTPATCSAHSTKTYSIHAESFSSTPKERLCWQGAQGVTPSAN